MTKSLIIRIVGSQEINHSPGNISLISPLAKSLMGKFVGDVVNVETSNGVNNYTILEVYYQ